MGDTDTARKRNYEESRFNRINNHAGCDVGTGICTRDRIEYAILAGSGQLLRPAGGARLQRFRSSDGGADGRARCAHLSWRTENQRLTFDVIDVGSH